MTLNQIALLMAAAASISLGIATYQRTPDRVWNRLFAIHAAVIGLWAFLNFLIMSADTPAQAAFYLRLSHPFAALTAATILDFAWVFPERMDYAPRRNRLVLYAAALAFSTVGLAPDLYYSIELSGGLVNVQYGWPLIPFGLFIAVTVAWADIILLLKAFRLEGVQRVQVIWVLLGLAGTHIISVTAIIVIPVLFETTAFSGWGATGVIIQLIGMSYAIGRHELLPPQMALRRVTATVLSVTLALLPGLALLRALEPALAAGDIPLAPTYLSLGLLTGLLVVMLHERVTRLLRQFFSPGGDMRTARAEAASHILRTLDADQLLDYLAHSVADVLGPTSVVVYTSRDQGGCLIPRAWLYPPDKGRDNGRKSRPEPIEVTNEVVGRAASEAALLTRDQIFRFASLAEARDLAATMDDMDAQIVVPMIWEKKLIGLVSIGSKLSGEMYSDLELRFVADMSLHASLALRNADLHAETTALKDFNESILRQMDNAVIVASADEKILVFNEASERLFGIEADRAVGASLVLLPHGIASCIRASIGSGRVLPSRHVEMERDGRMIPVACSTSPLEGEGDGPRYAVAVISDLTLIQELDREREETERLALIRVISAGMAHEIRNPLVAIRTFAELAPRRLDDPEFRSNFLTVAQQEITRIDSLVGDLLTLSKPADAVVEAIDVERICREVIRATSGMAEAREITLQLEVGKIERCPTGDSTRLHQALLNLISNAIEAEPRQGVVSLTAVQAKDEAGVPVIRIHVHNPGSFIPPEQTEEIFRPFVSKKAQGTGLGLAICQTIIEEHQGCIDVESTAEGGTEFTVELPLADSKAVAKAGDR